MLEAHLHHVAWTRDYVQGNQPPSLRWPSVCRTHRYGLRPFHHHTLQTLCIDVDRFYWN